MKKLAPDLLNNLANSLGPIRPQPVSPSDGGMPNLPGAATTRATMAWVGNATSATELAIPPTVTELA